MHNTSTHHTDRAVAGPLTVQHGYNGQEVPDVQAVCCRVKSTVHRQRLTQLFLHFMSTVK